VNLFSCMRSVMPYARLRTLRSEGEKPDSGNPCSRRRCMEETPDLHQYSLNLVTFPVPDACQILEIFLLFKASKFHHCGLALDSPLPNADINSPHGNCY
jgi:hypothetical protein